MKKIYIICITITFINLNAQETVDDLFSDMDDKYREDQFYLGLGINFILNQPVGVSQSGFSGGTYFGYIRDMPINKRRNIAIGVGLGLSIDTYGQNLFIGEDADGQSVFDVLDASDNYSKNRFSTQTIELPIHFRWRTSKVGDSSSFWRIYTGFNFGYMYYFKSVFEQESNTVTQTEVESLQRFRTDFYFSFGKSKINFFFKYAINNLFEDLIIKSMDAVQINTIKAGLVFYIL